MWSIYAVTPPLPLKKRYDSGSIEREVALLNDLNMPPADDVQYDVDMINAVHPLEVDTPEKTGTSCPRAICFRSLRRKSIAAHHISHITHMNYFNTL